MAGILKFKPCILAMILKVQNIEACLKFYTKCLGMHVQSIEGKDSHFHILKFHQNEELKKGFITALELVAPKSPPAKVVKVNHGENSGVYWKIAVHMPDVNLGVQQLQKHGVSASPGNQFMDIGFLSHISDPDNYTIELLQFTFERTKKNFKMKDSHPLKQLPVFGLITLRVSNIEASLKFYRDFLGMKLLVREDVSDYGFFLYFLAFTDDKPPSSNIDAVENREWLYQRQYTVLELQVFQDGSQHKFVPLNKDSFGFMGMNLGCSDVDAVKAHCKSAKVAVSNEAQHEGRKQPSLTIHDPDGIPITFIKV